MTSAAQAHSPSARAAGAHPTSPIRSWLRLVRIEHALMSGVGVFIGLLLAQKNIAASIAAGAAGGSLSNCAGGANCAYSVPGPTLMLLALLVPIFINIGAFSLNDYWDMAADKANRRRDRPLVNGELDTDIAIWTAILGLLFGILAGWVLNMNAGLVASAFALLSIAYNYRLKEWPLVGNLYIALSMAIAFIFGPLAAGAGWNAIPTSAALLFWGALFVGLGREIIKSAQDMEGDIKARGAKTLPIMIGEKASLGVAAVCYAAFAYVCVKLLDEATLSWNLFSSGLLGISAALFIAMAILALLKVPTPKQYEKMRTWSLAALAVALLATALAAL